MRIFATVEFTVLVSAIFVPLIGVANAVVDRRIQYSCIDAYGHVKACAGNARPKFVDKQPAAYVKLAQRINETGWAEMELETNALLDDSAQAYYAGYLEGFVTARLIRSLRSSMLQEYRHDWCGQFSDFIEQNLNWTIDQVSRHSDPYWNQVGLTLHQIAGIDDGYERAVNVNGSRNVEYGTRPHLTIQPCGVLLMNLHSEFGDIKNIIKPPQSIEPDDTHCSAMVKFTPDGDVLAAHNMWATYDTMLRIMKKMTLNYRTSKAKTIAMPSYPGHVFSADDFYITSTRLTIIETTLDIYDPTLWRGINATNMLFEFIRNVVANRLATNGEEWAKIFSRENGGTYNNQYMIVDYKRHDRKSGKIEFGLLTILEQIPNKIIYKDKTEYLRRHTYWASYNSPYYEEIFRESENAAMEHKYGDYFSHDKTPRGLIFARDHHKAKNVSTLLRLMRYNDFEHDEFSRCNCTPPYSAQLTIAARCDLNDPNGQYPLRVYGFRAHGATDAKVTSSALVSGMKMVAVSGPSSENVPVFSWATTKLRDIPHDDQPIEWNFKPILTTWDHFDDVFPDFAYDL